MAIKILYVELAKSKQWREREEMKPHRVGWRENEMIVLNLNYPLLNFCEQLCLRSSHQTRTFIKSLRPPFARGTTVDRSKLGVRWKAKGAKASADEAMRIALAAYARRVLKKNKRKRGNKTRKKEDKS